MSPIRVFLKEPQAECTTAPNTAGVDDTCGVSYHRVCQNVLFKRVCACASARMRVRAMCTVVQYRAPRQCLAMAKNMRMFLEGHTTLNKNVQVYSDPFSSDIHVTTQQSVCVNAEVSNVRLCLFLFRLAL